MKKTGILLLLLITLISCNVEQEVRAASSNIMGGSKVWAFIHFNVSDKTDEIDSYYYFANISKTLYESIAEGKLTEGFIYLENVKYWGNNDLIHNYKDYENYGDLVFRIEDIKRIRQINREPVAGRGYEQFEEPEKQPEKN